MLARILVTVGALLALAPAHAATSAQLLTPPYTSVMGGEQQVYSVRFFNAPNVPAVGQVARFSNDICGRFQNNQFAINVLTDATGTASVTFTAFNQGIGCWIDVSSGAASARYNVFTYTPIQVHLEATAAPDDPLPGQPFTLIAGAYEGAYPIYGAEVTATVIPGTINATITPGTGNMGQSSRGVDFEVTPEDRFGSFEVEVAFRDFKRVFPFPLSPTPMQDLWWSGGEENGWGMSIIQHRNVLFAVLYAYDAAGKPVWYAMSALVLSELGEGRGLGYLGLVYKPKGSPYSAYDASKHSVTPVGSASIVFQGTNRAVFDYTIEGVTGRKIITRNLFGPAVSGAPLKGLGDLWWGGVAQNGWGITVLQQHKNLFSLWFTYDAAGEPIWFAMPAGSWTTPDTYEGRLYRTTSSPWLGRTYDPAALRVIDVGTFRFRFSVNGATFDYVIDGVPGSLPLERLGF